MRKWFGVLIFAVMLSTPAAAYISGIAIQSDKSSKMQVYVNGKLYNKNPEKFVRIRSNPGLFHIELRVLNPYSKQYQVVKKDVRLKKGYDSYFRVVFVNRRPQLKIVKHYPVYSKYFLNPALYNKHPVS
jgi:hypothetical protein